VNGVPAAFHRDRRFHPLAAPRSAQLRSTPFLVWSSFLCFTKLFQKPTPCPRRSPIPQDGILTLHPHPAFLHTIGSAVGFSSLAFHRHHRILGNDAFILANSSPSPCPPWQSIFAWPHRAALPDTSAWGTHSRPCARRWAPARGHISPCDPAFRFGAACSWPRLCPNSLQFAHSGLQNGFGFCQRGVICPPQAQPGVACFFGLASARLFRLQISHCLAIALGPISISSCTAGMTLDTALVQADPAAIGPGTSAVRPFHFLALVDGKRTRQRTDVPLPALPWETH
jgi:hypothetical protein